MNYSVFNIIVSENRIKKNIIIWLNVYKNIKKNFKNLYILKKIFVLFIIVENREEFKFLLNNENIIGKLIIIYIYYIFLLCSVLYFIFLR